MSGIVFEESLGRKSKKPLSETNPYLQNSAIRNKMLEVSADSSTEVENKQSEFSVANKGHYPTGDK